MIIPAEYTLNRDLKRIDMTEAHHIKHRNNHIVFLDKLTVVITQEEDSWIAQGIEINYFAYGDSVEDAQEAFEVGLFETIKAYLSMNGNIIAMLQWAPPEILNEYYDDQQEEFSFTMVGTHQVEESEHLPVGKIQFMTPELKAA